MNRIELRGVIVPSDYDTAWAQHYIDKGMLMPESYFRRLLDESPADQPLDVYVNSPGGSVFAANEMVNAVREWKAANNQPVNVTIGAMAASAASAFTIMVADSVKAHQNAKMMFHGAWTLSIGGKEMHEDTANLLGQINTDIQARLVSKYKLQPETVSEWFAEGREGWLNAQDMQSSGIAGEIIEDSSDIIEFPSDAVTDIEQRGIGIAALLQTNIDSEEAEDDGGQDDTGNTTDDSDGDTPSDDADADAAPTTIPADNADADDQEENDSAGETDETGPEQLAAERIEAGRVAGYAEGQEEAAKRIEELMTQSGKLEASLRKMQSERDQLRSQIDALQDQHSQEIADMTAQLKVASSRLAKFLDGGLRFSPTVSTWAEALASCEGDYAKARKAYPELRREYNDQKR